MKPKKRLRLIPDTNTLLHFKWIEECDFSEFSKSITIVIVPQLIRELDRKCYADRSSRVRDRAREIKTKVMRLIDQGAEVQLKNGCLVYAESSDPLIDFGKHGLQKDIDDDLFVAHLIEGSISGPVALYSADGTAAYKARLRGFKVICPNEDWRLRQEPSAEERELAELRLEAAARPKLSLCVSDSNGPISFLTYVVKCSPVFSDATRRAIRDVLKDDDDDEDPYAGFRVSPWSLEELEEREEEERKKNNYVDQIEAFARAATLQVPLAIWNGGGAAGRDLHVKVQFQVEASLSEDEPELPKPPRNVDPYSFNTEPLKGIIPVGEQIAQAAGLSPSLDSVTMTRGGFPEANFTLGKAPQELTSSLVPLYLTFADARKALGFPITYEIRAANVPNVQRGIINVRLRIEEETDKMLPPVSLPQLEE